MVQLRVVVAASVLTLGLVGSSGAANGAPVRPAADPDVENSLSTIDQVVHEEMRTTGVPGVAVAVVHNDRVVFSEGYGVRALGEPEGVNSETVFQLASLSKPVSSTAVAALVGQKVIGWDDPVRKSLPSLRFSNRYVTEHVTFADLYSHRSGLPGYTGNKLEEIGFSRSEILKRLRLMPLDPFRDSYSYSNFGLTAAGEAAARAANVPFATLMHRELFGPAGMTTASARYADYLAQPNRAIGHVRIDGKWQPGPRRNPDPQAPAGGVSASVDDLARWVRLQLNEGTIDGRQVVAPDALTQTHTPHILRAPLDAPDASGRFYGLGWNVEVDHLGYTRWSHSGAFSTGASTTAILLPALDLGVVVLTNGAPIGAAEAIGDTIVDNAVVGHSTTDWHTHWSELFAGLFVSDPKWDSPPANAEPARPASRYTGTYANAYFGRFVVRADGRGGLTIIEGPAKITYPLLHWSADTFTYVESPELPDIRTPVTFAFNGQGPARSIDVDYPPPWGVLKRTG